MHRSGVYVGHWQSFYNDERQTNFLFAHERVKIAVPVWAI
jgi:hypothetical protein